ncbi:hypothetical protein PG991_004457 [Apiospora marii]|uniref:Uncharacterized protein n=1 Tax=Apiospora marii TaxID=335849 RepID=A0ABR1S6H3_9PEZI
MERRVGEQRPSNEDHGPGQRQQGQHHPGAALPPEDITNYATRPLPQVPIPRPSSSSSSNYEQANDASRDPSPAPSREGTVLDVDYSRMVEECGGTPDGFARQQYPRPDQKNWSTRKDVPLTINTDYDGRNGYGLVSPVSPSTPTQSYKLHVVSPHYLPRTPGGSVDMPELIDSYNHSPRRGKGDHAAADGAFGARDDRMTVHVALRQSSDAYDARQTRESQTYQVPSSLRVPKQPPDNRPAHRRSDPGSPSPRDPSIAHDTAQGFPHQSHPLRPGQQIGVPVLRARSHEDRRIQADASGRPPPSNLSSSQPRLAGEPTPPQSSRPPAAREKKISFAGPRVNSYLNRARASKQTPPPPPPPPLKLVNNRTTEGHMKTPFPVSSFDSDESDDDGGEKEGTEVPKPVGPGKPEPPQAQDRGRPPRVGRARVASNTPLFDRRSEEGQKEQRGRAGQVPTGRPSSSAASSGRRA